MTLDALVFGLFGAIIGSFLNVLILRRGAKTILGRSGCLSCQHELEPLDLVPVVSWFMLRGRCRYCGSRISLQYPLVEITTAIFFGLIGGAPLPLSLRLVALPVAALLIAISAYDIRHTIIPDEWVFALSGCALIFTLAYLTQLDSLANFAPIFFAGPFAAFPFAGLWYVSDGRWMGLGDAKLAWAFGWLLGPLYAFVAIVYAFVAGALISVCILLPLSSPAVWKMISRITPSVHPAKGRWGFTMGSEVAFGPFLAAACAIVWLFILYRLDPLTPVLQFLP
ncbi:MAG TPA: prepilin peptidase [Candidatus Paceibacterota bacterium]|nr:prepilin peptidase [Candidatus Paceibacterota bacterium]